MAGPSIAVVVVTYEAEGAVGHTLEGLVPQLAEGDELVVVDNASGDGTLAEVERAAPSARVLETGSNLGFAAACNVGAAEAGAPLLLFLNPDARPEPGALDALRAAASQQPGWGAWQALVTLPDGAVNTSGGVVHFLGIGWAGVRDPPPGPREVAFASGAALVVRRELWERLGGFDGEFFMYCEDVDLSLRMRLAGHGVGVVPAAKVVHGYEFHKGPDKWFLLERNRWWTVLATYPPGLLALVLPALLAAELGLLAAAGAGGWLGPKLRANAAVLRSLPRVLRRRRTVQHTRLASAGDFAAVLTSELDSPFFGGMARLRAIAWALTGYWRLARAVLR